MPSFLFIGGPRDGCRMQADGRRLVRLPEAPGYGGRYVGESAYAPVSTYTYELQMIYHDPELYVYVFRGMSMQEVVQALVENYPPEDGFRDRGHLVASYLGLSDDERTDLSIEADKLDECGFEQSSRIIRTLLALRR